MSLLSLVTLLQGAPGGSQAWVWGHVGKGWQAGTGAVLFLTERKQDTEARRHDLSLLPFFQERFKQLSLHPLLPEIALTSSKMGSLVSSLCPLRAG